MNPGTGLAENLRVESSMAEVGIGLNNTSTGGHLWQIESTGTGATEFAGKLGFYDNTAKAWRMIIDGQTGHVGIRELYPEGWPAQLVVNGGIIAFGQVGQGSPNTTYASPSNPASFTNAMNVSGSAMEADGLAISFTPKLSGNVRVIAAVDLFSTNPTFGTFAAVWYGTGTAPGFGATLPPGGHLVPPYRGSGYNPTALFPVYIPGLTVGTQYWFDLGHAVNAGGNGSHFNIAYLIEEV